MMARIQIKKEGQKAIPERILDVYLLPPVADMPELAGNKDTLPNPLGLSRLDPDCGC